MEEENMAYSKLRDFQKKMIFIINFELYVEHENVVINRYMPKSMNVEFIKILNLNNVSFIKCNIYGTILQAQTSQQEYRSK